MACVPGWGHVYWGRERLGLAIFTVAALIGFAWVNGAFIYRGAGRGALVWGAGSLLVIVSVGAWLEMFWRTRPERLEKEKAERSKLIRDGTAAYLRDEFGTALESFRRILKLFPQDIEALFRLGVISIRSGDVRAGRKWLRQTIKFDLEDKWRWEIERVLKRSRGEDEIESDADDDSEKPGDETPSDERAESPSTKAESSSSSSSSSSQKEEEEEAEATSA